MLITSRQNERIKKIKSLSEKDNRYLQNLYVAEGLKTVREAIFNGMPVKTLVVTEKHVGEFNEIFAGEILTVTDSVYKSVSDEVNPEGVMAVIEMPATSVKQPVSERCLLLDGIKDPGNAGTIIRTAVAAGYKDLYLCDCVDPFNLKVVRASMSGIYFVNLHIGGFDEIKRALSGYEIICADMDGEDVFSFKKADKFCLVVGSESKGIRKEVYDASSSTVRIPMEKNMESLNAGVSASILMYLLK